VTRAAVLSGLGAWLPPRVVTNDELAEELDTSDEWIRSRTGIRQRHIGGPGMATSDLALHAARRALASAGTELADAVVLATTTPDRRCPATAPLVAARLGLGTVPAYDVSAVCSGFIYGLATAAGLIAAELADQVLVIGADMYSTILDPADRSTRAIFGDGAGAVVVRAGSSVEPGALGPFDLGADGSGSELIQIAAHGSREPLGADPYFRMNGKAVFRQAVERMAASAGTVLGKAGWPDGQPDLVVAHQANRRILHAVADQLGIERDRCVVNLDRVGNTAAASVPIALVDAVTGGRLAAGDRVLLLAFGGGLAWGSCTLRWPVIGNIQASANVRGDCDEQRVRPPGKDHHGRDAP
jgi:3-oxoacyl-[acyl-carrier-protein] synthase III